MSAVIECAIERFPEKESGSRRRVYAKCAIPPHTFIFEDKPLFSIHFLDNADYLNMVQNKRVSTKSDAHDDIVKQLEKSAREAMAKAAEVAKRRGGDEAATGEAAPPSSDALHSILCADADESFESIIETNLTWCETQGIRIPYGAAVYRSVSCLNHACDPNAVLVFGRGQVARVVSVRAIAPDEEITISYADFGEGDCARKWEVQGKTPLPFRCMCATCVAMDARAEAACEGEAACAAACAYMFETTPDERLFNQLLGRVQREMNDSIDYPRQYKMLRLLMSQRAPWKRFSRSEKLGPAVLHLGLQGIKAALQSLTSKEWQTDAHFLPFVKEWSIIFASAKCNGAAHLVAQQRLGVLFCNYLSKFCRIIDVHSTREFGSTEPEMFTHFRGLKEGKQKSLIRDFALAFQSLLLHSTQTLFVALDEGECLETFDFYCAMFNMSAVWRLTKLIIVDPAAAADAADETTGSAPLTA